MSSIIKEIKFFILTAPNEKRPHWVSLFKVQSANGLGLLEPFPISK